MPEVGPDHAPWLSRFFAAPNGLDWVTLSAGSIPSGIAESVDPWLRLLGDYEQIAPIILPFVRDGKITGWYAAARDQERTGELERLLNAWFGRAWFEHFDRTSPAAADPMAAALGSAFGTPVFRFAGADEAANQRIANDLRALATLLAGRTRRKKIERRPVGAIRSEFDRALLVQDQAQAQVLLDELKQSARLNEENLRFLDVRMRAGLGLWPQIAHDHWLIKTLSELVLPPQIIADLIEALYRTHLDLPEASGSSDELLATFVEQIGSRYPRLFASRRGVRTPRAVKAFLLFERSRPKPSPQIIAELAALLPDSARVAGTIAELISIPSAASEAPSIDAADEAFDDGNFDRAIELYLALPQSKRTITRLIHCASFVRTQEAIDKVVATVEKTGQLVEELSLANRAKYEALQVSPPSIEVEVVPVADALPVERDLGSPAGVEPALASVPDAASGWLDWAAGLREGTASTLPADAAVTWDADAIRSAPERAQQFADRIGNVGGDRSAIVRNAIPSIHAAFLGDEGVMLPSVKPIANTLFMLVAMDDGLSSIDLALLSQLLGQLLEAGVSSADYLSLLDTLSDVEERMGSPAHVGWSLDVAEALALAPAPSVDCQNARQQFFLLVVGKTIGFAHRLRADERHAFRILAQDYGIDREALGAIDAEEQANDQGVLPDLSDKTIGIYTLTEAAGSRAKSQLETMFPGVEVILNADLVATARLASLAKNADFFVFAWRSSSHSAYYCIKEAMDDREPIMPLGKGTASIVRAVIDAVC
ncbi:protein DpdD [Sphingopyxis granuli]|uniref:protein DpdD n=1 Tax=Sphingopyxis granuli TaxID=267128 RepID=UPI0008326974|nr:protein DpdD [Sphingopyxis granuli]